MLKLEFDAKGLLKPYLPIPCELSDLKTYFVDGIPSVTRKTNYDNYIRYSNDLKTLLGNTNLTQWINGSFVTKKTNPKDIDLITFIDHGTVKKLGMKLDPFRPQSSWLFYGVDAYIVEVHPENSKSHVYTLGDIAYWLDLFSQTRPNRIGKKNQKGFLEINY